MPPEDLQGKLMEWKFPRHTHLTEVAAFSFLKAVTECRATDKQWGFFSSSVTVNRAGNAGLRNTGSRGRKRN